MFKKEFVLISILLSLQLVLALPNDAQTSIDFTYPTQTITTNYSLVNVNNSIYWQSHTGTDGSWLTGIIYTESDPKFISANSTLARIGNCSGKVVQNITANGVQCVDAGGSGSGSSYNLSYQNKAETGNCTGKAIQNATSTGVQCVDVISAEADTLQSVTDRGAVTTNPIQAGTSKGVWITAGNNEPFYLMNQPPVLGFNGYYADGWKFGQGSVSRWASFIYGEPDDGSLQFINSGGAGDAGDPITGFPFYLWKFGGDGSLLAGVDGSADRDILTAGTITGATLTDGTCSISGGSVTGCSNILYTGGGANDCYDSALGGQVCADADGKVYSITDDPSDATFKNNTKNLTLDISQFSKLKPSEWTWTTIKNGSGYGLVAQDLEVVYPQLVKIGQQEIFTGYTTQVIPPVEISYREAVENVEVNTTELKKAVCYYINGTRYDCNRAVVNGTKIVQQLKSGVIFDESTGKFYLKGTLKQVPQYNITAYKTIDYAGVISLQTKKIQELEAKINNQNKSITDMQAQLNLICKNSPDLCK